MNYPNKKLLAKKSFNEVVATWLKDEWSNRYCRNHSSPENERIVLNPDLDNEDENQRRKAIMVAERADAINWLPSDTEWYSVDFTLEDIDRTFLIPIFDWPQDMTNDTYRLRDAVVNQETNYLKNPDYKKDYDKVKDIGLNLNDGSISEKIILIASSPTSPFTVLEGNHRLIAIVLKALKDGKSDPIIPDVFFGISPLMKDYYFHVEKWRPEA